MELNLQLEMEALGILRQTKTPESLKWMNDDEKRFMLELLYAGEEGLHKRVVEKFVKQHPDTVIKLDGYSLVQWERDKNGRVMFLTLTWQGFDAARLLLKVAQSQSKKSPSKATVGNA